MKHQNTLSKNLTPLDLPVAQTIMEVKTMANESTMNKLIEMRFTAMADAFRIQLSENVLNHMSFEERLVTCPQFMFQRQC